MLPSGSTSATEAKRGNRRAPKGGLPTKPAAEQQLRRTRTRALLLSIHAAEALGSGGAAALSAENSCDQYQRNNSAEHDEGPQEAALGPLQQHFHFHVA